MPRVAKNRRLKRQARRQRQRQAFTEMAGAFQVFMRENGCDGYVTADANGVTVSSHPPAPAADDPVADVRAAFAGMPGTVTENADGSVTYRGDGSVIDCSKTGGVGFSL